jgi:hypothetical protein
MNFKGGIFTGIKELAYSYIDKLNEQQLEALVVILQGISGEKDIPEVEPDEWDLEMIKSAEAENDGETIPIEELAESYGINYDEL